MTSKENHQDNNSMITADSSPNYKESVRGMLFKIIGNTFEEDIQEVSLKLNEEREKAVGILVEENKSAIKEMVEEGKKLIQAKAQAAPTSNAFQTEYIDEVILHIYRLIESSENDIDNNGADGNGTNGNDISYETPEIETTDKNMRTTVRAELEILPPRDQDEIEAIGIYMNAIPGIVSIELKTMMDKSVYIVESEDPIDFVKRLQSLPQVLAVEKIWGNGSETIQITLNTKSKLAKTQDEMNAKVKKIFHNRK